MNDNETMICDSCGEIFSDSQMAIINGIPQKPLAFALPNELSWVNLCNECEVEVRDYPDLFVAFMKAESTKRAEKDKLATLLKEMSTQTIKIKYFDNEIDKIEKIDKGDWIDLRSAEYVEMKAGEYRLIPLGVGMILPEGYEAHIVPRSSTFKNFGIIQTNHCGVIDESYCGDNDQWCFPAYALRDTIIHKNDRICQFRIVKKQPNVEFEIVDCLNKIDRGGFGSTGKR